MALLDAHGAIETRDGGLVLFRLTGNSNLRTSTAIHVMAFATEHHPTWWINDVIAVRRGRLNLEAQALSMRYYECQVEARAEPIV